MSEAQRKQSTLSKNPSYAAAKAHYLSPSRRDPVKREWEERFSKSLFRSAAEAAITGNRLSVVDVGSGTGDALHLLEGALKHHRRPPVIDYLGLDLDPDMVEVARDLHRDRPRVEFAMADIRDGVPDRPTQLYLASGVPYSHLTREELTAVLADITATVRRHRTRSVVVLDVLGRYSMEWEPYWDFDRWTYAMTFFQGGEPAPEAKMSFYGQSDLAAVIADGTRHGGLLPVRVEYFDRSIGVGRHTVTGAFNPALPPYRELVNRLFAGDVTVALPDLRIEDPCGEAPPEVLNFFTGFATRWNERLWHCAEVESTRWASAASRTRLARQLRDVEFSAQRGLGAGHSLICLLHLDGSTR